MKLIKTAVAAGLMVFVMTASAQSSTVRASIPFKFTVANEVMPAGEYVFKMDRAHSRIEMYNREGAVAPVYLPILTERTTGSMWSASLTFNTYGSSQFLRTVKAAGTEQGWDLFKSRSENELAKTAVRTTTEVALVR